MRVAFNASPLLSPLTGIGQYTLNLARELQARDDVELDLFYSYTWSRELRSAPSASIGALKRSVKRWLPYPYELSRAVQQYFFTHGTQHNRAALYHEPSFLPFRFAGPTVITVHDLSWIRFPDTHPPQRVKIMNKLLPRAIASASHILVVSDFVRQEVIDHYRLDPSRVTTTPLAPRPVFFPRNATERRDVLARHRLTDQSYFLYVGTLEPRKNVEVSLRAHALLPEAMRRRVPLVLVGMRGWLTSRLETEIEPAIQQGECIPFGFVPDSDLASLYSGASAVLYPSIYEGFGMPPLEAMACGTPVIMSNASSLPEVAGSAAILHDPHDVKSACEAMRRLIEDDAERQLRAAASLAQAKRFSWRRCADQTVAVYRQVLAA